MRSLQLFLLAFYSFNRFDFFLNLEDFIHSHINELEMAGPIACNLVIHIIRLVPCNFYQPELIHTIGPIFVGRH